MAYNQHNLLDEIQEIQDIYSKHIQEGVTAAYIFRTYIKDIYHISQRTFFTYLSRNVKKERRELHEKEAKKQELLKQQGTLFEYEDADNDK